MITNILKTLSDTELIVIAQNLSDPNVDEQRIYKALISKGNQNETFSELVSEMNSDNFRGTLPRLVGLELAERLKLVLVK